MDRKKIIIASIAIVAIATIALIAFFKNYSREATPSQPEITPPAPDSFPVDIEKNNGLPTGKELRNNTTYIHTESGTKEDLSQKIDESLRKKEYSEDINWTSFATEDDQQIALNDFISAAQVRIDPQLIDFLDPYNYDLITCKNENNSFDHGLILNNKLFKNYPNLEQDETKMLRSWEPTMLKDLNKILFPGVAFSSQDLNQTLSFKSGKYRYAEVILSDGKKSTINYGLIVDSIVFTTSLSCMDHAFQQLEGTD